MPSRCRSRIGIGLLWACGAACAQGQPTRTGERAVTVLADFETPDVAAQLGEPARIALGDCQVNRVAVPARGQGSLALELGATAAGASVACQLTFRVPTRFTQLDRLTAFCWLNEGEFQVAFRIRDARGQLFETPPQPMQTTRRWAAISVELKPAALTRVHGEAALAFPVEIDGFRVTTQQVGRQTVFLDDLQVEHQVRPDELIRGSFEFDEPTRIYEPGATVAAQVVFENRSREKALTLNVDLAWIAPDGSGLQTQRADVSLPASGAEFRSHRKLDFSQRIREPGLYRLVAQARAAGWSTPHTLETTLAVTPSNRRVSRGRATLFGLRANLLREPELDQRLEIAVARDLGVNLLAFEASWATLEPKRGAYQFAPLQTFMETLGEKGTDLAAMLVLRGAPEWAPSEAIPRATPLVELLTALHKRFGERSSRVLLDASATGGAGFAAQAQVAVAVRERLAAAGVKLEVLPPALASMASDEKFDVAAWQRANPAVPLVVRTAGQVPAALASLAQAGVEWRATDWWLHDAQPLAGPGFDADAEDVLRYYVRAAAAGVAGLLWFDLRDDDTDPAFPEGLRGLVRRDFSPRATLLGYASAAGQLTGCRYAGPVEGAPDAFESALFVGGKQQVAVLIPRANRVLPAVLSPAAGAPGELVALDFARRTLPLLTSSAPPLLPVQTHPLFVTLTLKSPQPEPKLSLARPWLRVPATALVPQEGALQFELDAPRALKSSYWQLRLPKDAPLRAAETTAALRGAAKETLRGETKVTWESAARQSPVAATLRVSLEGEAVEVPFSIQAPVVVPALAKGEDLTTARYRLGELTPPPEQRASVSATAYAALEADRVLVAVVSKDDQVVGLRDGQPAVGDRLLLGWAWENLDEHMEVTIAAADERPVLAVFSGGAPPRGLSCTVEERADGTRVHRFTLPRKPEGVPTAGPRYRLALRYVDDDADGFAPVPVSLGGGLDGSRATGGYFWLIPGDASGR